MIILFIFLYIVGGIAFDVILSCNNWPLHPLNFGMWWEDLDREDFTLGLLFWPGYTLAWTVFWTIRLIGLSTVWPLAGIAFYFIEKHGRQS